MQFVAWMIHFTCCIPDDLCVHSWLCVWLPVPAHVDIIRRLCYIVYYSVSLMQEIRLALPPIQNLTVWLTYLKMSRSAGYNCAS